MVVMFVCIEIMQMYYAVDMGIMHEIYNSGYAQNNSCVFRDWNRMHW